MDDQQFEQGEVLWFNTQKRFGFIKDKQDHEIFFHFSDGKFPVIVNGKSGYSEATIKGPNSRRWPLPDPVPGDYILFERTKGSRGRPKASPWTYQYMLETEWVKYEDGKRPCAECGHPISEHAGSVLCMMNGCHCGDEAYQVPPGMETDGPREVSTGDSTGGFSICQ